MAPETFPKFLDLPKEIQILIWEAAVRPVPGDRHVHHFFIADYHLKRPDPLHAIKAPFLNLLRVKNHAHASSNHSTGLSLAIPKDDVDGNPNDSVYLSDSSLWTVCKESRQAMERRFDKNEWWSKEKTPFHPKRSAEPGQYLGQENVTHTASYRDDEGSVKHITIDYQRDLIHLDPRHLNSIDWFHHPESDFLPIFDMRDSWPEVLTIKPSFVGEDIALDFDRSTCDELFGRKTHFQQENLHTYNSTFFDTIEFLVVGCQRRVWLIDHALVPAAENLGKDFEEGKNLQGELPVAREVFRSNDCIYTEVKSEDIGPLWQLSDYDKAYDGENHHAFDCWDCLQRALS